MSNADFAAGASAARNKLAKYLKENGIDVRPSHWGKPPTDEDFLKSVLAAFAENQDNFKDDNAMVIFKWWQVGYRFAIPISVLQGLSDNPKSQYPLFSGESRRGDSTFYLTATPEGTIEVYRKKHWRRDGVERIDTTILYPDLALDAGD